MCSSDLYPTISRSWRAHWERITPFFAYPDEIRKVIYTTNAVESLNYSLRRVLKTRGSLPSDQAIVKLLYLAIQRASKRWTRPVQKDRKSTRLNSSHALISYAVVCLKKKRAHV